MSRVMLRFMLRAGRVTRGAIPVRRVETRETVGSRTLKMVKKRIMKRTIRNMRRRIRERQV